jgi:hypothetical protein
LAFELMAQVDLQLLQFAIEEFEVSKEAAIPFPSSEVTAADSSYNLVTAEQPCLNKPSYLAITEDEYCRKHADSLEECSTEFIPVFVGKVIAKMVPVDNIVVEPTAIDKDSNHD